MRRGRPAHPDVLTPREWEVLALLRERLTNGAIAQKLGISESGARFHVSEILSKLGVQSREEAAAWQPRSRSVKALTFTPSIDVLRGLLTKVALTPAGVLAVVAAAAAVVTFGAFALPQDGQSSSSSPSGNGPGWQDPCESLFTYQCIRAESQDYSTLGDVVKAASFEPTVPSYIPEGYEPIVIRHTRPQGTASFVQSQSFKEGCPGCDPRLSHNDQVGIYYRNAAGGQLAVLQGFPAYLPLYDSAAADRRGKMQIGGRDAFWVQGVPGSWNRSQIVLYMELGRVGLGWEESPDRSGIQYGSPMSFSITGNDLSLDELISIAESAEFP